LGLFPGNSPNDGVDRVKQYNAAQQAKANKEKALKAARDAVIDEHYNASENAGQGEEEREAASKVVDDGEDEEDTVALGQEEAASGGVAAAAAASASGAAASSAASETSPCLIFINKQLKDNGKIARLPIFKPLKNPRNNGYIIMSNFIRFVENQITLEKFNTEMKKAKITPQIILSTLPIIRQLFKKLDIDISSYGVSNISPSPDQILLLEQPPIRPFYISYFYKYLNIKTNENLLELLPTLITKNWNTCCYTWIDLLRNMITRSNPSVESVYLILKQIIDIYLYPVILGVNTGDASDAAAAADAGADDEDNTISKISKIIMQKIIKTLLRPKNKPQTKKIIIIGIKNLDSKFKTTYIKTSEYKLFKCILFKLRNGHIKLQSHNSNRYAKEIQQLVQQLQQEQTDMTKKTALLNNTSRKLAQAGYAGADAAATGGGPHLTHLKIDDILDDKDNFMDPLQLKIAVQLGQVHYDFENARTLLAQTPLTTRGSGPESIAAATKTQTPAVPAASAAAVPAAAPATVPSAEEDLKNKLVERIVAAIDRSPIPIKLEIKQLSFSNVHNILNSSPLLSSSKISGGSKKKSRTVTIKSDSMPKTVKGLKTRKKLLKKKIRKMNKRIKLNKKRIVN